MSYIDMNYPRDILDDFINKYLSKITLKSCSDDICDMIPSKVARVAYGATRICFILKDCDFVLKMNRPECGESYSISDMSESERYNFMDSRGDEIDYCDNELTNYREAIYHNISDILLPIEYYCDIDCGLSLYVQPKYDYAWKDAPENVKCKIRNQVKQIRNGKNFDNIIYSINDGDALPPDWLARVIQLYGKGWMKNFEEWTNYQNVNDLHGGNVGFKNGYPIIIDYAGCY